MQAHSISHEDLAEAPYDSESVDVAPDCHAVIGYITARVEAVTGVLVLLIRQGRIMRATCCGRPADVVYAAWLIDVCARSIVRETRMFRGSSLYRRFRKQSSKRSLVRDFKHAMARRLVRRLDELQGDRPDYAGPGLVPIAVAEIDAWIEREFGVKRPPSSRRSYMPADHRAASAGRAAGDQAQLDRPLSGPGAAKALAQLA